MYNMLKDDQQKHTLNNVEREPYYNLYFTIKYKAL